MATQTLRKEDIFRQLDSLADIGGDIAKAKFITHLYQSGSISEREAIALTTEYIKRCEKREQNRH